MGLLASNALILACHQEDLSTLFAQNGSSSVGNSPGNTEAPSDGSTGAPASPFDDAPIAPEQASSSSPVGNPNDPANAADAGPVDAPTECSCGAPGHEDHAGCDDRDHDSDAVEESETESGELPGEANGEPRDAGAGSPAHPADGEPPGDSQTGLPRLRLGAGFAFPEELKLGGTGWSLEDAFPGLIFDVATTITETPGTGHLFVTQQNGQIYAIRKNAAGNGEATMVIDLSATTQGGSDCGLLGLAFHPEFNRAGSANRAYVYIHRAYSPAPIQPAGQPVEPFTETWSRLSRFTVDLATLVVDPASEQILIEQHDQNLWHQGGALLFNPHDGFLYVTAGDEGDILCSFDNCQRIDKDLFSGVLRIDVDQRGGNISHPIVRQPKSGITANYYIPNDNPFVGDADILEEFYAIGLRSPHRMTYDPVDDLTIIGDVGQIEREELDVLARGANYQWGAREGLAAGPQPVPATPIGIWTDPILELQREEAQSLIGGYVYRGRRFPELWGKYIFGDFGTGNIWALSYDYDGSQFRVLDRELLLQAPPGLASFGVDADGELYLLYFGLHPVRRLERVTGPDNIPTHLSDLGLFSGAGVPADPDVLLPYSVQSPLWSDGATKDRWVMLPAGAQIGFSEHGAWEFPVGSAFIKHFGIVVDERFPERRRPLETRLFVHSAPDTYYGITYKWNDEGTDAVLLRERRVEYVGIIDAEGRLRQQRYTYPSPADCMTCHNEAAGRALGVRTAQLNGTMKYESGYANQLLTWAQLGLFGDTLSPRGLDAEAIEAFPRLAPLDDESRSLEDRVRSYWESNCSMCHGVDPSIRATWDARYTTPLDEQGVLGGEPLSSPTNDDAIIWPGDPSRSVLFRRGNTTNPNRKMPPLGRSQIDLEYVELLSRWIQSLAGDAAAPADSPP